MKPRVPLVCVWAGGGGNTTKTESNRRERQEKKLDFLLYILTFLPGDLGATTELYTVEAPPRWLTDRTFPGKTTEMKCWE